MRIAIIIYSMENGGAERVTALLANHWVSRSHDVAIVTADAGASFYPLDSRVRLIGLATGRMATGLRAAIQRIVALRALLQREKINVAIGMTSTWCVELALARIGLRLTAIGSERTHPPKLPIGRSWEILRRHTYRFLDGVVVQTERTKHWVEAHTNARRVTVITNPVVLSSTSSQFDVSHFPDAAKLVIGVGRLVQSKRFDLLIRAFANVAHDHPDWHLAVVGDGPEMSLLQAAATATGFSDRIHLVGRSNAVGGWYQRAEIYVSTSEFEGYPNTLLEAMSSGVACIAADCETGPSELISNGVNGVLIPVGDESALVFALNDLMNNAARRRALAMAALDVGTVHALDHIAAQWEAFAHLPQKDLSECGL